MKTFFFFGSSITLGVSDAAAGGWVSRFAGLASKAGLPVPPSTFYNLGARKYSTRQIRERWLGEYRSRLLPATEPYLVFCFGSVDMAAPNGNVVVPLPESVENARVILNEAKKEAPVLLMSTPPVKNPEQQARIQELSIAYGKLCSECNVGWLDLQTLSSDYVADLSDGIHPGPIGNQMIAESLIASPVMLEWIKA